MMLLETIGGRKITEDMEENNTSHVYYPEWIHNLIEEQAVNENEEDAKIARKLATVGLWCIQWHAMDRPSMQMVVQMFDGDVDTVGSKNRKEEENKKYHTRIFNVVRYTVCVPTSTATLGSNSSLVCVNAYKRFLYLVR